MTYTIAIERGDLNYAEIEPLYRRHYAEMQERLRGEGVEISAYNPRLDEYFRAFAGGWLLNFVIRCDNAAVGYSNVYITTDMHNQDLIAQEDTIYVVPEHRNGAGRKLVKFILAHLEESGVKRAYITPVTDERVALMMGRMGFRAVSSLMVKDFKGKQNVRTDTSRAA